MKRASGRRIILRKLFFCNGFLKQALNLLS
jgi:hypothetical protein